MTQPLAFDYTGPEAKTPAGWQYRYRGCLYVTSSKEQAQQGFDVKPLFPMSAEAQFMQEVLRRVKFDYEETKDIRPSTLAMIEACLKTE